MEKIKTIIGKEWAEVFKNKMVISVIVFMPLLFTAMMLGFLYIFRILAEWVLQWEIWGICRNNLRQCA